MISCLINKEYTLRFSAKREKNKIKPTLKAFSYPIIYSWNWQMQWADHFYEGGGINLTHSRNKLYPNDANALLV